MNPERALTTPTTFRRVDTDILMNIQDQGIMDTFIQASDYGIMIASYYAHNLPTFSRAIKDASISNADKILRLNINRDAFKCIQWYLHFGKLQEDADLVALEQIASFARTYDTQELMAQAETLMDRKLTKWNSIKIFNIASRYQMKKLASKAFGHFLW